MKPGTTLFTGRHSPYMSKKSATQGKNRAVFHLISKGEVNNEQESFFILCDSCAIVLVRVREQQGANSTEALANIQFYKSNPLK